MFGPATTVSCHTGARPQGNGHEYPFHNAHIAERYGLLTIIVLGEPVLAGALAFGTAADVTFTDASLLTVALGSLLLVFSMW